MKSNGHGPFENIIVGVDFSKYSKIVVKQAEQLAQQFGAKLVLVHAVSPLTYAMTPEFFAAPEITEEDLRDLEHSIADFYKLKTSDQLEIHAREGLTDEVIIEVAKSKMNPMIVVGSQGKNAVSRFVIGSEAEKVALEAPFPVWVHRGRKIVPLEKILVPTDLSSKSQKLIQLLGKWSKDIAFSPRYLFVRPEVLPLLDYPAYQLMNEEIRKSTQESLQKFRKSGPDVPLSTVSATDPPAEISHFGKDYDVIAMNPHNHSGLFNKFGRVTAKVIRMAENPVLVVKT